MGGEDSLAVVLRAVSLVHPFATTLGWLSSVIRIVPDPYLDEVFHVRQAQEYCKGNFATWDSKITTPPGLYLLSAGLHGIGLPCDIQYLRATNVVILTCLVFSLTYNYVRTSANYSSGSGVSETLNLHARKWRFLHSASNICISPLLFFFSGLYYTDVLSTSLVLLNLAVFQHARRFSKVSAASYAYIILTGLLALFVRQTNIFWVAVFPAGLAVCDVLESRQRVEISQAWQRSSPGLLEVIDKSWKNEFLYNRPISMIALEDVITTCLSLGLSSLRNLQEVLLATIPQLLLLVIFGGFVGLNGGVVLGDKSNHIATIHIPQMLYIWPLFMFFSAPILLPRILPHIFPIRFQRSPLQDRNDRISSFPRLWVMVVIFFAVLVVIRFNTIIHPFTLADNRHYVFYVFKILRLHPLVKYLVAPVYLICGWFIIQALDEGRDGNANSTPAKHGHRRMVSSNSTAFLLVWLITTTLCLVTAPLVEPRYFILPWIIWRVHIAIPQSDISATDSSKTNTSKLSNARDPWSFGRKLEYCDVWLVLETVWFYFLNAVIGYVFLYREFGWPQEPGSIQRFLW